MTLTADLILDRRRLRRKLTFWRVIAVLVLLALVALGVQRFGGTALLDAQGPYIARISIEGLIRSDRKRAEIIEELGKSSSVKGVVLHVDSPGGTVVGAEQLHKVLRELSAKKALVAVVDGMAASGGYITALAADQIFASQGSLVGSIGVILQFPNFGELLKNVGVKVEEVKSSPLKAAPNGYEPTSPEARVALESLVKDSYGWFKQMVRERRNIEGAALDTVSDGRVHTGRQALGLKLVDAMGDEKNAIKWLETNKNISTDLPVRDVKLDRKASDLGFLHTLVRSLLEVVGLERFLLSSSTLKALETHDLDGLLVVWHPPAG